MTKQHEALVHLANFILKEEDAPCSAQSHLDYAVSVLSELVVDWDPRDEDIKRVILEAREHTAFYHQWAKKPWPSISNNN